MGGSEVKRFRKVLVALLAAALLLLQTIAAFGAVPQETDGLAEGPRLPAALRFPDDPGEPLP